MTLDEQRRMAMLEATLREIRRIAADSEKDPTSVPLKDALEGQLLRRWKKVSSQINMLLP